MVVEDNLSYTPGLKSRFQKKVFSSIEKLIAVIYHLKKEKLERRF